MVGDAFGRMLSEHLHGGIASAPVLERDDGRESAALGPEIFFSDFDAWPASEREAMTFVRGRVLDLGCGAGRHSLYLQEQGLDVVAVDESSLAAEVARERGVRDVRCVSIADVDASFGHFGTILMLCGNFGLLGDADAAVSLLRGFVDLTDEDGRIVAEAVDPYASMDAAYVERNRAAGRMSGLVRLRIRYGDEHTRWWDQLNLSVEEMRMLVDGTGWVIDRVIDGDGGDYIAILRRDRA